MPTRQTKRLGGAAVLGVLVLGFGVFLLNAWLLMVALGIVKGVFGLSGKWAIGFWPAAGVTFALGVLKTILFGTSVSAS